MLDELEARKERPTVRDVLEALVRPVNQMTEGGMHASTYIRFVANLQLNNRALFRNALGDKWNRGYRRCLSLLRELLGHVPPSVLEQRMSMMGIYANAIFAAKEVALTDGAGANRFWTPPHTLENILDTLQAVLEVTPSHATLTRLK